MYYNLIVFNINLEENKDKTKGCYKGVFYNDN